MSDSEKLDQRIQLVASKEFGQKVDAWRRGQDDLPSRSEAIRRLVYLGLVHEEEFPMRLITAIIRPHKYEAVREALAELGVVPGQRGKVQEVTLPGFLVQRPRSHDSHGS